MLTTHATAERLIGRRDANYYRILDLGCGLAPLLPALRQRVGEHPIAYRGVDISAAAVEEARRLHGSAAEDIAFVTQDVLALGQQEQLPWYNVVVGQDLVEHLDEPEALCDLISKVLVNAGVFYLRARLAGPDAPDDALHGAITRSRFDAAVVRSFEREALYDLHVFESEGGDGQRYVHLFGHKKTAPHFERYHYAFGYEPQLGQLKDIITPYVDKVNHFGDQERTFRHEGYLSAMTEEHFGAVMASVQRAVDRFRPGRCATYMKDKLNIQHTGMRFRLHQDATAYWNQLIGPMEFVTLGVPLDPVLDASHGGTRIVLRQPYRPTLIECTASASAVDPQHYGASIGQTLQYINCLAAPGTYYAYDQYVLHDSTANERPQSRHVLFITCVLTEHADVYSRSFARRLEPYLETRPGLDVKRHAGRG